MNTFSYESTNCGFVNREYFVPEFCLVAFDTFVLVDPICVTFKWHKDTHTHTHTHTHKHAYKVYLLAKI